MKLALPDIDHTERLAARVAEHAAQGDVIVLQGDLGSGKTTFARYCIQHLLYAPEDVTSPTFTLVHTYTNAPFPIWHCDLYRLRSAAEAHELGLEDAFHDALTLIEWPEIIEDILPLERLVLRFSDKDGQREVYIEPHGKWEGVFRQTPT